LRHGLVARGIEGGAEGRVALEAELLEHLQELALDQLDPLDNRGRLAALAGGVERPVEVVEHRQQVADQRFVCVADVLVALALRTGDRRSLIWSAASSTIEMTSG